MKVETATVQCRAPRRSFLPPSVGAGHDNTMVKAQSRAFRWRKLLETGTYATVEEIARAEKINTSYVSRVLRLTLLAPEIIEMILDGRHPTDLNMAALMAPFPVEWEEQKRLFLLAIADR